jgi:hypothetical protein
MYSSAQSEITKLKQTISAEKRNVQQLFNKRDNLITSYQIVAKDYIIANAKKDSLSQKPNSPAYKNAIKKADKLLNQRNQLLASIEQMKQDIDSINLIIADYESKLQQLQSQKAESKKDKNSKKGELKHNKSEKPAEKPSDKKTKTKEQNTEAEGGRTLVMQDEEFFIDNEKTDVVEESTENEDVSEESNSSNDDSSTSSFSKFLSKVWKFIKICFWVICGIIFIIIVGKATSSSRSAGHRSSGSSSGGSSSSRSSSSRSSSTKSSVSNANKSHNELIRRQIEYKESELARLQANLEKTKHRYQRTKVQSVLALIQDIKQKIIYVKADIKQLKGKLK